MVWRSHGAAYLFGAEQVYLSDKKVYLFCSHGTGGLANSVELITEAALDAVISDNIFHCYEEEASSSQRNIQSWLLIIGGHGNEKTL